MAQSIKPDRPIWPPLPDSSAEEMSGPQGQPSGASSTDLAPAAEEPLREPTLPVLSSTLG